MIQNIQKKTLCRNCPQEREKKLFTYLLSIKEQRNGTVVCILDLSIAFGVILKNVEYFNGIFKTENIQINQNKFAKVI